MGRTGVESWTVPWNRGNAYPLRLGGTMKKRTKEERQAVARRIFEALCTYYPDRYIVLEQPKAPDAATDSAASQDSL
jgi:hypothetical protein